MAGENEQGRVVPDEERARQILEQLKSVHAFDLAYETMVGLVNFGSQKMGLLEETREVRDLDDARLSIELVRAILEVLEREQGDERTRGLHDALAQMQLAYAHAVQLANAERAARDEAAAGPAAEQAAAPAEPEAADPEAGGGAAKRRRRPDEPPKKPAAKKKPRRSRAEEEAGRRGLSVLRGRQTPERAQKRASSSSSPASTTMNSSSCGPLTSFSRKRSEPVRCSSGRS